MSESYLRPIADSPAFSVASFPGSSAPERDIEVVHVEKAWYFFLT